MKVISSKTVGGKKRVVVEIDEDDDLIAIRADSFYRLTDPHDEVMPGHVFLGMRPTCWCSLEQKWVT